MRPSRLVMSRFVISRLTVLLLCAGALAGCMQRRVPVAEAALPSGPAVIAASPLAPALVPALAPALAPPLAYEPPYRLDSGDRLRIQVFGQDGLTNSYTVDAGGNINFALIGPVPARGYAPEDLARAIAARLRQGYIRAPHVTAEIEAYRPFFILGEVTAPGQYPYVANMTAETAIAIAGGYAPRARKNSIELTRTDNGLISRVTVPAETPIRPGDTITVSERWF
jgi:polysaccharide export outer membrane protein